MMMKKAFARLFLWLSRLNFVGDVPKESIVLVAGPHTSNWDFLFMLSYAWAKDVPLSWLGKEELFKGPMGPIMRWLGGVAVDRSAPGGMVHSLVGELTSHDRLALLVPAEGTRAHTPYWKSGFYRIALEANVPVVCGFVDSVTRTGGLGSIVTLTGDVARDMDVIRAFYDGKKGVKAANTGAIRLRDEDPPDAAE